MSTFTARPIDIQPEWYIVDATGKTLGRLATRIATILRGKHKPIYTPHMDTGDYVIVVNVEKIAVTGNKVKNKTYYSHSGYPGGIKSITFEKLVQEHPERILLLAVKRMLPKGPLGNAMFSKLKVYAGKEHPHVAQLPKPLFDDLQEKTSGE